MNPLYLLVGKSASGKSTIADILERTYGHKSVESYTTRKPRYDGERGHIFISESDFDNLGELVAYTEYDGNRYGTTSAQLDECSLYVVDIPGIDTLLKRYNTERPIRIIYFNASVRTRILRMIDRSDSDMAIIKRLLQDEQVDWYDQLEILTKYYSRLNKDVKLFNINAEGAIEEVLEIVLDCLAK